MDRIAGPIVTPQDPQRAEHPIFQLIAIMARLRDTVAGCPWDIQQTFASIAPYTIEEAYEVADAIKRGDMNDLREELGDLLLQVIFHSQMAEEVGAFNFADVVDTINSKMTRRHPHVFAGAANDSAEAQARSWETLKAEERAAKSPGSISILDGIAVTLPALTRAEKLSKRAAGVGFVWPDIRDVLDKLKEEIAEFEAEIAVGDRVKAGEELGDMLFVCANIARELKVDAEASLSGANAKFVRRFQAIEKALAEVGSSPALASLDEMEQLWKDAKRAERTT